MADPRYAPREGFTPTGIPLDVTGNCVYHYYYRYRLQPDGAWTAWEEYDVGTVTIYLYNPGPGNQTYDFEQRTDALFNDIILLDSWTYPSEVVVEPTPNIYFDNYVIDPATPQNSGDWDYTFDVNFNPAWSGDEADIQMTVTIRCYDAFGVLQETFVQNPPVSGGQCTGTITLGTWSAPTPGLYGYFELDVSSHIPDSAIPDGYDTHTYTDTWEGDSAAQTCFPYTDLAGGWGFGPVEIRECEPDSGVTVTNKHVTFKMNYDAGNMSSGPLEFYLYDGYGFSYGPFVLPDYSSGDWIYTVFNYTGPMDGWYVEFYDYAGYGELDIYYAAHAYGDPPVGSCYEFDPVGIYSWDDPYEHYAPMSTSGHGSVTSEDIYYHLYVDTDSYANSENSIEIIDGNGVPHVVANIGDLPDFATNHEITGVISGYTGSMDGWEVHLMDSYGDYGVSLNSDSGVSEGSDLCGGSAVPVPCYGDSCPPYGCYPWEASDVIGAWTTQEDVYACEEGSLPLSLSAPSDITLAMNYDSGLNAAANCTIELHQPGVGVVFTHTPSDSETGTDITHVVSSYSGNLNGWFWRLIDSAGNGDLQLNYAAMGVNDPAPSSCYGNACPSGCACVEAVGYDLSIGSAVFWWDEVACDVAGRGEYWIRVYIPSGAYFNLSNYDDSGNGEYYYFEVYDDGCSYWDYASYVTDYVFDWYNGGSDGWFRIHIYADSGGLGYHDQIEVGIF